MSFTAGNLGLSNSDRESSDTDDDQMAQEEARIAKELERLQEKQRLLKAKRESAAMYKKFMDGSSVQGGPASTAEEVAMKKKQHLEDLRNKLAKRTTIGKAPGWNPTKKPSPVRAPTPLDQAKPPPAVKGKKFTDAVADADRAFATASRAISKMISDVMEEDGTKLCDADQIGFGFVGAKKPHVVPTTMPHEKQLEALVLPEKLCSDGWNAEKLKWDAPTAIDENVPLSLVLQTIFDGLKVFNGKMELFENMLHLHSVAHIHVIKAGYLTRLFCVAGAPEKEAVTTKLVSSLRAVILSSDRELKHLPFRDLATVIDFCSNKNRVEKLALFCLHYIEYGKNYAQTLTNVLFAIDFQNDIFWPGEGQKDTSLPAGGKYLPRFVTMFMLRVARAAHNFRHLNDDVVFPEAKFKSDMKALLYNTARNLHKRERHQEKENRGVVDEARRNLDAEIWDTATVTTESSAEEASGGKRRKVDNEGAVRKRNPLLEMEAEIDKEREELRKKREAEKMNSEASKTLSGGGEVEVAVGTEDGDDASLEKEKESPPSPAMKSQTPPSTEATTPPRSALPPPSQKTPTTPGLARSSSVGDKKDDRKKRKQDAGDQAADCPAKVGRSKGVGKRANAYERAMALIEAGITAEEFTTDLQAIISHCTLRKQRKARDHVEVLLDIITNSTEDDDWTESVEDYRMHLEKLPANP